MASKKLKITVEQKPFQRDWPEKGKKQILDELQSDLPLKMDNYITKRAELSLQIRIVKSTPFMISTKGERSGDTSHPKAISAPLGRTPT